VVRLSYNNVLYTPYEVREHLLLAKLRANKIWKAAELVETTAYKTLAYYAIRSELW